MYILKITFTFHIQQAIPEVRVRAVPHTKNWCGHALLVALLVANKSGVGCVGVREKMSLLLPFRARPQEVERERKGGGEPGRSMHVWLGVVLHLVFPALC